MAKKPRPWPCKPEDIPLELNPANRHKVRAALEDRLRDAVRAGTLRIDKMTWQAIFGAMFPEDNEPVDGQDSESQPARSS